MPIRFLAKGHVIKLASKIKSTVEMSVKNKNPNPAMSKHKLTIATYQRDIFNDNP